MSTGPFSFGNVFWFGLDFALLILYIEQLLIKELEKERFENSLYTFVNPFSYDYFLKNSNVTSFNCLYIDGASLVFLFNFFNKRKVDRVSFDFSSIAHNVFSNAVKNGHKVSIIGGTEDENSQAVKNLKKNIP
jgi:N-acetylglucosaminyldiphosphoundecaprenol N-acetyl-beta-D-mannosaminyltransferase